MFPKVLKHLLGGSVNMYLGNSSMDSDKHIVRIDAIGKCCVEKKDSLSLAVPLNNNTFYSLVKRYDDMPSLCIARIGLYNAYSAYTWQSIEFLWRDLLVYMIKFPSMDLFGCLWSRQRLGNCWIRVKRATHAATGALICLIYSNTQHFYGRR